MATYNPNPPVRGNPFLNIPPDTDSNPFRWVSEDIASVFSLSRLLPLILLPLHPLRSGPLDELYPSLPNLRDVTLHIILILSQLFLLFSLPVSFATLWAVPFIAHAAFYASFALVTSVVVRLLNGRPRVRSLIGVPTSRQPVNDESELWFFINGIATGTHWHQSNLNVLAETFGREIVGIHNPTKGLLLDILECLIQRDLDYKTADIRQGRAQLRAALSAPSTKKVVLIAHSQGGIIAASIIDWLFGELGHAELRKLEVYTFASAARAMKNPPLGGEGRGRVNELVKVDDPAVGVYGDGVDHQVENEDDPGSRGRVLRYIEHYANTRDFVSNIGVLRFTSPVAAYSSGSLFSGSVFVREGSGHLLNMHYLDTMFGEEGGFMSRMVDLPVQGGGGLGRVIQRSLGDLSRLRKYKDGRSPEEVDEVVGKGVQE
ncbi:hypothetical protein BDW62DRAFT_199231 [Aspergillus aurantiobrunneus]